MRYERTNRRLALARVIFEPSVVTAARLLIFALSLLCLFVCLQEDEEEAAGPSSTGAGAGAGGKDIYEEL